MFSRPRYNDDYIRLLQFGKSAVHKVEYGDSERIFDSLEEAQTFIKDLRVGWIAIPIHELRYEDIGIIAE